MSSIDPDAADDMDQVRTCIEEMIAAMLHRADKDKYHEEKLKDVYRNVVKPRLQRRVYRNDSKRREPDDPSAMWPDKPVTYERLFGFGDQARAYRSGSGRDPHWRPLLHVHFRRHNDLEQDARPEFSLLVPMFKPLSIENKV